MGNPPLVSLIVLTFNNKSGLETCLKSIANQSYKNIEVIVIDNSPENYAKGVKAIVISNKQNLGATKAHNQGVMASNGEYIARIDDDLELDKNYVSTIIALMEGNKKIGIMGGKMFYHHTNQLWFAGGKIDLKTGADTMLGFGEMDTGQFDKQVNVDYLNGGMIVRKELYDKVGLLDESFFVYHEDIDFCVRAKAYCELVYAPKAVIHHNQLHRGFSLKKLWQMKKSRLKFALKWGLGVDKLIPWVYEYITNKIDRPEWMCPKCSNDMKVVEMGKKRYCDNCNKYFTIKVRFWK